MEAYRVYQVDAFTRQPFAGNPAGVVANADGFLYLSMAQFELGDYAAATQNDKTYQELKGQTGGAGTP